MTSVLVIDNYDSFTYNLVQDLGELGAEVGVVRNDKATVDELRELRPDRLVVSPGPCTPKEAGISVEAVRSFAEARHPGPGSLPRAPVDGRGVRRHGRPRRPDPWQGRRGASTTAGRSTRGSPIRWSPAATTR